MKERIDFHSHILPGADHGSTGIEMSLGQVALLREHGIEKVVATPHFYPNDDSVRSFLERRTACAERLKEALPANAPEIYLGAEVLICNDIDEMEDLEKLCVEGTGCLLLEMPFVPFSNRLLDTVDRLSAREGLCIVLAHIDRYDEKDIDRIMEIPVLAQVNGESLRHRLKRGTLEKYFALGRVVALGTDLHGIDRKSMKNYEKGLLKLGTYNEREIYGNTAQLLENAKAMNR